MTVSVALVANGHVRLIGLQGVGEGGAGHAQGFVQLPGHQILPGISPQHFGDVRKQTVHDVVVVKCGPELPLGFDVLEQTETSRLFS